MSYIETKWQACALSDRLLLAHYDEAHAKYHILQARKYLINMLAQDMNVTPDARGTLVDVIENAMDDVHDMDVTFNDYAEAIIDALLDHVVPMPEVRK